MLKTIFSKVMWVGSATVFAIGLVVMLAVVLGVTTTALAAVPGDPFRLGQGNTIDRISQLVGSTSNTMLRIDNNGTGSALQLLVEPGRAPLTVNSTAGKATNFDADKLDGKDSTEFLGATQQATDADKLDGKDSTAFGIKTAHASVNASDCDNNPNPISTFNECAPVTVTVPAGKQYIVSVWSSFSAKGGASNQDVTYCSAGEGSGISTTNPCVTPFGRQNKVTVVADQFTAAASSGDTVTLNPGTYTFFTGIKPTAEFANPGNDDVITKVLIRDVSTSLP